MIRSFLFVCLLVLTGCIERAALPVMPEAIGIGTSQQVFVATLRKPAQEGLFGPERAQQLQFLNLDISVPPERDTGQIRLNFGNTDPYKHFTATGRQDFARQGDFSAAIRSQLQALPPSERDVMLYVHGYNNSFAEGVFRIAQMMADYQVPGVAVHYSWASSANPLGYTYDRDSVLFSRDGLEQLLRAVSSARPRRIVLVGHSLGTMLVMESLRQIEIATPGWSKRHLGGVVLISPDLDVELFRAQADRFAALPQPFVVFVSSRDRALKLSARINGNHARLGGLQDPAVLADLPLTVVDISEFATGLGPEHFTLGTSPLLIQLLGNSVDLQSAFDRDRAGRSGLLPGTVLTVRNTTHLILSPLMLVN